MKFPPFVLSPLIYLIGSITLFTVIFQIYEGFITRSDRRKSVSGFEVLSSSLESSINNNIEGEIISSFLENSTNATLTLDSYRKVIEPIDIVTGIYFVAVEVFEDERESFEKKLSEEYDLPSTIVDINGIPSEKRDSYWASLYHPFDFGRGVDLKSEPLRFKSITDAIETSEVSYSLPIIAIDTLEISTLKTFPVISIPGFSRSVLGRFVKFTDLLGRNFNSESNLDGFFDGKSNRLDVFMIEGNIRQNVYTNGDQTVDSEIFRRTFSISDIKELELIGYEEIDGVGLSFTVTYLCVVLLITLGICFLEYKRVILHKKTELNRVKAIRDSEEKSKFMHHLSHEIRNPMHNIIGTVGLIDVDEMTLESQNYIDVIKKSGKSLMNLVNDVLDVASIESGKIELKVTDVNIRLLVIEIVSGLSKSLFSVKTDNIPDNIKLIIHGNVPFGYIKSDKTRISQVLMNLLSNAIKYTEKGSIQVNVNASTKNNQSMEICIKVADTGIGMSSEQVDVLFTPFTRFYKNKEIKGTGLGLSISRPIAKLLGGDLTCVSETDQGSEFTFTFETPGTTNSSRIRTMYSRDFNTESISKYESANTRKYTKSYHIRRKFYFEDRVNFLIVDDIPLNIEIMKKQLQIAGATVFSAEGGKESLVLCMENVYDMIFMDNYMPGIGGIEATTLIRSSSLNRDTPLIFVTADVTSNSINEFFEAGANDFLGKPFESEQLFETIMKYIGCLKVTDKRGSDSENSTS